jgi:acetyl esterase/lipase
MALPTPTFHNYAKSRVTDEPTACLDLYLPPSHDPSKHSYKTLVFYHGGGLTTGTKSFVPTLLFTGLLSKNYILISADYTLLPDAGSTGETIRDDMHQLETWLLSNHAQFGIDTNKIAIAGASAGAYVAAMSISVWSRIQIRSFVDLYGMVDIGAPFFNQGLPSGVQMFLNTYKIDDLKLEIFPKFFTPGRTPVWEGLNMFDVEDRWGLFLYVVKNGFLLELVTGGWEVGGNRGPGLSGDVKMVLPFELVGEAGKGRFPPTILMHGEEDTVVPYEGSLRYYEKLREAGVEAELYVVKGAEHGLLPGAEKRKEDFGRLVEFVDGHM